MTHSALNHFVQMVLSAGIGLGAGAPACPDTSLGSQSLPAPGCRGSFNPSSIQTGFPLEERDGASRGESRLHRPPVRDPVPIRTLVKGHRSGIREPLEAVARTSEDWSDLWRRHSPGTPRRTAPDLDLDKEMVAAVFLGEKHTGGYTVEITRADTDGSTLFLYYRTGSPNPQGMVIQVLTQPYHMVRLPKLDTRCVFVFEAR